MDYIYHKDLDRIDHDGIAIVSLRGAAIELNRLLSIINGDALCCPRCGQRFHDQDLMNHPEEYWTCEQCGTIQHVKCIGIVS